MMLIARCLVILDIPNPWEFIKNIGEWIKDIIQSPAVKGFVIVIGIIAAVLISWFLARFSRWLKQVLGNLATPTGFLFFILSLIAFIVILFKYDLL